MKTGLLWIQVSSENCQLLFSVVCPIEQKETVLKWVSDIMTWHGTGRKLITDIKEI